MAGVRRDGFGQDRCVLRRSGQAGLRSMGGGESLRLPLRLDCDKPLLDRAALGALYGVVGPGIIAEAGRLVPSGAELPRSLLVVALVLIILVEVVLVVFVIIAVVVGLSGRAMRLMDLVVPELAIGAVLGEQLGMRTALDRPAP